MCILIAVFIVIRLITSTVSGLRKISSTMIKGRDVPFPKITNTYQEIFPLRERAKLTPSYTFYSGFKDPIATFNYQGDRFSILVYKINIDTNVFSLKNSLQLNYEDLPTASPDVVYNSSCKNNYIRFNDANVKPEKISNLFLNIDGENIYEAETDSTCFLKLSYNSFSLRFSKDGIINASSKTASKLLWKQVPIELLFLKKKDAVFMLMLSPTDLDDKDLNQRILPNIIQQ